MADPLQVIRGAIARKIVRNERQLGLGPAKTGGDGEMFPNPFTSPPGPDPWETYDAPSVRDRVAPLRSRPRGRGTQVTVRAYDIPSLPGPHEHMYVEYDDGREQLIARGGPSADGGEFVGKGIAGRLQVVGGVSPASINRDYGKGRRVVFEGFVPEISAQEAAAPARQSGRMLQDHPRQYGWGANSNSYAADAVEPLFAIRPGDRLTPGYDTRLKDAPGLYPWFVPARAAAR